MWHPEGAVKVQVPSWVHGRLLSSNGHFMPGAQVDRLLKLQGQRSRGQALLGPLVAGRASCRRQEGAAPRLTTGGQPRPGSSMIEPMGCDSAEKPKDGSTHFLAMA